MQIDFDTKTLLLDDAERTPDANVTTQLGQIGFDACRHEPPIDRDQIQDMASSSLGRELTYEEGFSIRHGYDDALLRRSMEKAAKLRQARQGVAQ